MLRSKKFVIAFTLWLVAVLTYLIVFNDKNDLSHISSSTINLSETYRSRVISKLSLSALNNPRRGCVMPRLKRYNDVYQKEGYTEEAPKPLQCSREADWLEGANQVVSFSQKALKKYQGNIKCNINFMKRIDDFSQTKKHPSSFLDSSTGNTTLPLQDDFLYGNCRGQEKME